MSDATHISAVDSSTVNLNALADRIDALTAAWKGDELPPNLAEFVPPKPSGLRRLALVEMIKVDLEYRWLQHELPKTIEEYVDEFPELARDEVPCDLIYEEFHIRRQTDDALTPEAYYSRFPQQAERLQRMMSIEPDRLGSTTILPGLREAEVDVGQEIDDFDLLVRLGKGSFGSVFLARQRSMQRIVALKISRDRGCEPQTLAQLDHPNIVRVYDQRTLPERRLQLMYMQHIPGGALQDVLAIAKQQAPAERSGKIVLKAVDASLERHGESAPTESPVRRRLAAYSWPEAVCWIGARLAAALQYAHQHGVLHRDIKPANVLLSAEGSPKLVDFNVSFSSKLEGATPAAYFGGSLIYMSPEQIEAYNPDHERKPDELDGRSDVYSLGIVLWELLTGDRPFGNEHLEGNWDETLRKMVARRHAGLSAEMLAALPANMPPGLQDVLTSCLAPNVKDRPATAGLLARQLDLCLQPHVQELLRPPPESKRHWLRRWPISTFIPIGLTPSIILSIFNLGINGKEIIGKASVSQAVKDFFDNVQVPVINAVTFSMAIFLVVRFSWPVMKLLRRAANGQPIDAADLPAARRRALWIGDYAFWLGMFLWIFTGLAFPTWLYLRFGNIEGEGAGLREFGSFLASQFACGGVSSTITFFLMNLLMVRVYYPVLVRPDQAAAEEVKELMRLERRCAICFYATVAAPFIAFGLMLALVISSHSGEFLMKVWMGMLTVIGAASCIASFKLLQIIRADLAALAIALGPDRESTSG